MSSKSRAPKQAKKADHFNDLNLLERQNLARAAFLQLATRNILGEEAPEDEGFSGAPMESYGIEVSEPIALSDLKRKMSSLAGVLKSLVSMLPEAYKSYSGLTKDHEKFRVYETDNYKEIVKEGERARALYEDIQEELRNYLKSPKKTREMSRVPSEWGKIVDIYKKAQEAQGVLNDIIKPLTNADRAKLKITATKEYWENLIKDLTQKQEDLEALGEDLLKEIETLKISIADLEDEIAKAAEGSPEKAKAEKELNAEIVHGKRLEKREQEVRSEYVELEEQIEKAEKERVERFGKGRYGGALAFRDYIYGRLHFTETSEFKAKIIYDFVSRLQEEGSKTDKLMEKVSGAVYSGTPAFGFGRSFHMGMAGSGYDEGYESDEEFVERKFR